MAEAKQPDQPPRTFVWLPVSDLPTEAEQDNDQYTMLLQIEDVGVTSGFYQQQAFHQHCQRYDSFDDEPVEGWTREQEINNNLEWETEQVYPKGHPEAVWNRTVLRWMLVPAPPGNPTEEGHRNRD